MIVSKKPAGHGWRATPSGPPGNKVIGELLVSNVGVEKSRLVFPSDMVTMMNQSVGKRDRDLLLQRWRLIFIDIGIFHP